MSRRSACNSRSCTASRQPIPPAFYDSRGNVVPPGLGNRSCKGSGGREEPARRICDTVSDSVLRGRRRPRGAPASRPAARPASARRDSFGLSGPRNRASVPTVRIQRSAVPPPGSPRLRPPSMLARAPCCTFQPIACRKSADRTRRAIVTTGARKEYGRRRWTICRRISGQGPKRLRCLRSSAVCPPVAGRRSQSAGAMTAGRERGAVHGGKVGYRLRKVHRGEAVFHGRRNREAPAKRVRRWNRKLFFLFLPVLAFESLVQ